MGNDQVFKPLTANQFRLQQFALMSEAVFQTHVVRLAARLGWKCYHTHDSRRSQPGYPDLHLWHPLHGSIFRELKTMKGKLSPDQVRVVESMKAAGIDVSVWQPSDLDGRIVSELKGDCVD